jgi:hypothetical protein
VKTVLSIVRLRTLEGGKPAGAYSPARRRTIGLLLALPMGGGSIISTAAPEYLARVKQHDTHSDHEVLNHYEYRLVAAVSDLMLPTTDTPGALAAGVPQFIDRFLAKWNTAPERDHFLSELRKVDIVAQANQGRSFLQLDVPAQYKVLRQLEEEAMGTPAGAPLKGLKPFFKIMKEYVVVGYYTSEVGVTQELKWTVIPGRYVGCTPCADRAARAAAPL